MSNQAKHKGPWRVCSVNEVEVLDSRGVSVADMAGDYEVEYERMADNARLIAAAPELLGALCDLLPILDNDGPLPRAYADIGERARAAIIKATSSAKDAK
jgi:hypothetical protein